MELEAGRTAFHLSETHANTFVLLNCLLVFLCFRSIPHVYTFVLTVSAEKAKNLRFRLDKKCRYTSAEKIGWEKKECKIGKKKAEFCTCNTAFSLKLVLVFLHWIGLSQLGGHMVCLLPILCLAPPLHASLSLFPGTKQRESIIRLIIQ